MEYNILIVDDSMVTRAVLKKTIKMAEIPIKNIYQAANGQLALDVIAANAIDIVLADLNMPVMNGIEMTAKILENPETKDISIVVISTEASTSRINELRAEGIKGYIHKPFTPEKVRDELNAVLGIGVS